MAVVWLHFILLQSVQTSSSSKLLIPIYASTAETFRILNSMWRRIKSCCRRSGRCWWNVLGAVLNWSLTKAVVVAFSVFFLTWLCCSLFHQWVSNVLVCCHQLLLVCVIQRSSHSSLTFGKIFCWESHEHPKMMSSRVRKPQWEADLAEQESMDSKSVQTGSSCTQGWLQRSTQASEEYSSTHVPLFTELHFTEWFAT